MLAVFFGLAVSPVHSDPPCSRGVLAFGANEFIRRDEFPRRWGLTNCVHPQANPEGLDLNYKHPTLSQSENNTYLIPFCSFSEVSMHFATSQRRLVAMAVAAVVVPSLFGSSMTTNLEVFS